MTCWAWTLRKLCLALIVTLVAVAGISNPPLDWRSPSGGRRTSTRSAVMRTDCSGLVEE